MAHVTFATFFDVGHLNPTYRLAKMLTARGHRVTYLSIRDTADTIRAEGLDCRAIFEDLYPKGAWPARIERRAKATGLARVNEWRKGTATMRVLLGRLLQGELDGLLKELSPDLFIFDNLMPHAAIWARGLGFKPVQLNTNVPWRQQPGTPPPYSSVIPRKDLLSALRIQRDELKAHAFLRSLIAVGATVDVFKTARQFARKYGYPVDRIETGAAYPVIDCPELVLCPREFVEMGTPYARGECHFLEAGIDLTRKQADFPWERLDPKKKLVFCSLGTLAWQWTGFGEFFNQVISGVAQRKDWQVVMAVGKQLDPSRYRASENVICVQEAPQLALLEKASAAVVHGGFNTVKECIYFGVPMVVFPVTSDQPGNAARVVFHGLGLRGDKEKIKPAELVAQISRVMDEPSFRERIGKMSARFREVEARSPSMDVLEQLMARPAARPAA